MKIKGTILAVSIAVLLVLMLASMSMAAAIQGYLFDPNWYAPHPYAIGQYGTGQYECAVSGSQLGSSSFSVADDCDIFGAFSALTVPSGTYSLASWDNYWRSTFMFNKSFSLVSPTIYLRLRANMWSYGPSYGSACTEFGQTFAATGSSVVMVVIRSALAGVDVKASIHDGGPGGPQVGPSKTQTVGDGPSDTRYIWNGGEVPTIPGHIYYLRLKAPAGQNCVLCFNSPVPDNSDAMPEGAAYANGVSDNPASDLGVTICSDDDGVLTNMFIRPSGYNAMGVTSAGETFTARGVNLLSFSAWLPDTSLTYIATLYNSPGGTKIGIAKRSRVTRWGAPEVQWVWSPGVSGDPTKPNECPLTPGNTYYIEVTAETSTGSPASFTAYCNSYDQYPGGRGYTNRNLQAANIDVAGTIMEEESAGSAARPTVAFTTYPNVAYLDRAPDRVTVRWMTDVASDSTVEYSAVNCPYTNTNYDSTLTRSHIVTITGLKSNTIYHFRAKSTASGYKTGVSRDICTATTNDTPNLLANPGFEEGTPSTNPHKRYVTGWNSTGMDVSEEDGTHCSTCSPGTFLNKQSYAGAWSMIAAANSSTADGKIYQTVDVTPGVDYNFTVAVSSWMIENDKYKYDVWTSLGRLDYIYIGIDPFGGNNPNSMNVKWTARMYSHTRYTLVGTHSLAYSNKMSVFVAFGGKGGDWHIFGIDDARLSAVPTSVSSVSDLKANKADGLNAQLTDLVVTAASSEAGAYYVENADRTQGIRVESSNTVAAGKKVTVTGVLQTNPQTNERYLANATLSNATDSSEPEPLFMNCPDIGGAAIGQVPALAGSEGPHNTGLLIRIAGKVTVKDTGGAFIYINDGSMSGNGVRVDTSHISSSLVPDVNANVGITGISSIYYDGANRVPLVIARRGSDITPY